LSERTNILDYKNMRVDLWHAAVEQWKLDPLIGTGSRTYLVYGRKFRTDRMQLDPVYTHNDYLQLLAEYGIAGAGAFLLFFGVHARRGWISAQRLGRKRIAISHRLASNTMALNIGALGALAAYAVHSIFDFNLHIPANVLLMAFVFGIIANPGVARDSEQSALAGLMFWRIVMFVLAAFLGFQVWRFAPGEYYAERSRIALRDYQFISATGFGLKALEYEKENPIIYYNLGRARALGGNLFRDPEVSRSFYEAAVPALAKARELAPLDKTYSTELALTYDKLARFPEAEWLHLEALALDPKSTSTRRYYEAHLKQWSDSGKTPAP
jgi:hypothetical protein